MRAFHLFILLAFSLLTGTTARGNDYLFQRLGIKQGLSNNTIASMMVDNRGFLWIGTAIGLNRYDGYEVKTYKKFAGKDGDITANNVRNIMQDAQGNIWIEHNGNTARYTQSSQICTTDNDEFFANLGITAPETYRLDTDEQGSLWMVCEGKIYCYNYTTQKLSQWKVNLRIGNENYHIATCAEGIYVCIRHTIYKFITKTGKLQRVSLPANMTTPDSRLHIYVDSENVMWAYSMINDLIYNTSGTQVVLPHCNGSNATRYIHDDGHGNIWIATDHNGVFIYNRNTKDIQHLTHDRSQSTSISSDNVTCITTDRQGTVWLGHYKTGVSYTNPQYSLFQSRGLQYGDISVLCYDKTGNLWLGTDGNGAFIERHDGTSIKANMPNVTISSMLVDHNGSMWVGTYNSGLYRMNGTNTQRIYTAENKAIPSNAVWQMAEDNHHNIWFTSAFHPVTRLNIDTEKCSPIMHHGNPIIGISLAFDGNHTMYIGSYQGVLAYDTNTGKSVMLNGNRHNTQKILQQDIVSLCFDKRHNALWIAHPTGISILDIKRDSLTLLDTSNGLFDNYVKTIVPDRNGNMWISTGHGISCVQMTADHNYAIHNFTSNEGLQNTFFNTFAGVCSPDGNILMGGNEGYTMISPQSVIGKRDLLKLSLTEVTVGNRIITPDDDNNIYIDYDDNQIVIKFFTGNLTSDKRVLYAYRLKGVSNEWIYTDENYVSFFSLPYGKNTLEIKAADENGEWGEVMTLTIHVAPPFYLAWWMIVLYIIALICATLYAVHMVKRRNRRIIAEQRRQMEQNKQAEMTEMKMRFFTNVSHDLRTPLTLIITPLQGIIREMKNIPPYHQTATHTRIYNRMEMIHKNAMTLMAQLNMLLDFRRLDGGGETLDRKRVEIIQFLTDICISFDNYSEEQHIALSHPTPRPATFVSIDPEKISKVIYNLLSNAFKFTPAGGSISVDAHIDGTQDSGNESLIITVADTGRGVPDSQKETIFQRFAQVHSDDPKAGSGIGLNIAKEYVTMHGGTIQVTDNTPAGSIFTITLPQEAANEATVSCTSPQETTASPQEDTAPPQEITTILVVDDNHDLCQFIADSLRDANAHYSVLTAADGQEALSLLDSNDVTLVVTDVMMPRIDGMELCRRIKSNLSWSHIPVIMLTAKSTDVAVTEGLRLGADDYITKPFNIDHLMLRIERFLEWSRKSHESFSRKIEIEPSEITITSLDEEFIKDAIQLVEDHMSDTSFSVEAMSKALKISRANLYKKMMTITGKGPHDFIRALRLKRAYQLLEKSQRPVSEIASEVGYNSTKRFTENFKAEFNMTPTEFVKNHSVSS